MDILTHLPAAGNFNEKKALKQHLKQLLPSVQLHHLSNISCSPLMLMNTFGILPGSTLFTLCTG